MAFKVALKIKRTMSYSNISTFTVHTTSLQIIAGFCRYAPARILWPFGRCQGKIRCGVFSYGFHAPWECTRGLLCACGPSSTGATLCARGRETLPSKHPCQWESQVICNWSPADRFEHSPPHKPILGFLPLSHTVPVGLLFLVEAGHGHPQKVHVVFWFGQLVNVQPVPKKWSKVQ